MSSIGEKIKEIRIKLGMTQDELANKTNITKAAISRYELGQRQPSLEQLQDIADALGIQMFDLVNLSEEKRNELDGIRKVMLRLVDALTQQDSMPAEQAETFKTVYKQFDERLRMTMNIALVADQAYNSLKQTEEMKERQAQMAQENRMRKRQEKKRTQRLEILLSLFDMFSDEGQEKVIEHVRELSKIPDYQRNQEPDKSAD